MKVTELRIGNLVYFEYQVVDINIGDFHIIEKESKFFKPIPLTEEWLLKLGFELHSDYIEDRWFVIKTRKRGVTLEISLKLKRSMLMNDNVDFCDIWNIKYVHQLQNLYFALTGKELTI